MSFTLAHVWSFEECFVDGDVAVFVDLENISTSLWNAHRQASDPRSWIDKALQYGLITFARAYADFGMDHMRDLEARLRVAGIEPYNCPSKVRGERAQSTVDMNVAIDMYEVAQDQPRTQTFVLFAGDSDYVRIVNRLRLRLGRTVVIAGVPGSISRALVEAAGGNADPLEIAQIPDDPEIDKEIVRRINEFEATRRNGVLPVFRWMAEYLKHDRNRGLIAPELVEGKLSEFKERGVLRQEMTIGSNGEPVRTTQLDRFHPFVQESLIGLPDLTPREEPV
jgi:uncharacterized LabA/DUF88 family protein